MLFLAHFMFASLILQCTLQTSGPGPTKYLQTLDLGLVFPRPLAPKRVSQNNVHNANSANSETTFLLFVHICFFRNPREISEGSEGLWICWHSSFKLYLSTGVRMYVVQCKSTPFQQQTNLDSCFKESTSAIHLRLFWTLSQSVTRHLCCNFMF